MSESVVIADDERELITAVTAATAERLSAAACSVALLDGAELIFVAAHGAGAEEVVGIRIPTDRGLAGWVVSSGQAIAVADVRADRRFDIETAESTGYIPASILAVPVDDGEEAIGVLEVLDRAVAETDLAVAAAAARQVGLIHELARRRAGLDADLSDPELGELVGLLRELRGRPGADRRLAAGLLRTLLDSPR